MNLLAGIVFALCETVSVNIDKDEEKKTTTYDCVNRVLLAAPSLAT